MQDSVLRRIAVRTNVKGLITRLSGEETYMALRHLALRVLERSARLRTKTAQSWESRRFRGNHALVRRHGLVWDLQSGSMPEDVRNSNYRWLTDALSSNGIRWWLISNEIGRRRVIGISVADRDNALNAIASGTSQTPRYVTTPLTDIKYPMQRIDRSEIFQRSNVWRLGAHIHINGTTLYYGLEYGCDLELWDLRAETVLAPRENRAAKSLSAKNFELTTVSDSVGPVKTPNVMMKRMLDDVPFPIDIVYTWVDGSDPEWAALKQKYESGDAEDLYHPGANNEARFRSRDELKYSLRSLEMYAPWFNRIFIVTNGQIPDWLDLDNPKMELVTHEDIYDDDSVLPTFNSNSIISRLHHIPNLNEHYIYMNDDVFFGRSVQPDRFFYPNGLAQVSVSNNRRPFGEANIDDEPHFNLTRNMRSLLEEDFGITISRAIKHTPHPQLRSINFELEERYKEAYRRTWASRFRHHNDLVADQLHTITLRSLGELSRGRFAIVISISVMNHIGAFWLTLSAVGIAIPFA